MCGIFGIFNSDSRPIEISVLEKCIKEIVHRGPNALATETYPKVGFAHSRLSIMDLSEAANQPMCSEDGRYALIYNGEIYNFDEIRKDLCSRGHSFRSTGDTEVVLNSLIQWGPDALSRFNGMFALAFLDNHSNTLLLARDRYGIKPLYYSARGETLVFGSEIKALLAHPSFVAKTNTSALLEYMTFQNIFSDNTLFDGIKCFPAGSYVQFSLDRRADEIDSRQFVKYWDFDFSKPGPRASLEEYAEELDRLFEQAVLRQMRADVPVGGYLSGGMDTASIVSIASQHMPNLKTFTVGFEIPEDSNFAITQDERAHAHEIASALSTVHKDRQLQHTHMENSLPHLVYHLEDLRVGQSYPNLHAAELASQDVKVVFTGTGGDELFAGYPWRYLRVQDSLDFTDFVDRYYSYWQRIIPNREIKRVFRPIWSEVSNVWTRDIFESVFPEKNMRLTSPEEYIQQSLYFEAKTFLHGLLVVEDKLSMAYGLETRVPFLDNDLVDFAQTIPVALNLGHIGDSPRLNENDLGRKTEKYLAETSHGKRVLRKMMERRLPRVVTQRAKNGFSGPDADWFRDKSVDYVRQRLMSRDSRIYNYFDYAATTGMIGEHLSSKVNRRLLIWSLLCLEQWLETFID